MGRKPTKTIRVDLYTHKDLDWLSKRMSELTGRYLSRVDIVRMGVTLVAREYDRRRHGKPDGDQEDPKP